MKKGLNKFFIVEIILLILLLFNSFVFKISNTNEIALILVPFLILFIVLCGFKKEHYRNKKDVLLNLLIYLLMYYFITYILGFLTGFIKTAYSLSPINIIKNTFPVILLILVSELLRYEIFTRPSFDKLCKVLGFLIFVLIDINAMVHLYDVTTALGLVKMICLVIFPSITKNILLIYLTMKVGYTNCIFYRLITEISTFLLPIFPDFGEYISVLLETVFPILILLNLNNKFGYFELRKIKTSRYNKRKLLLYSVITFSLLVIVMLSSGFFKYQALAIGSNSMKPKISKGDVIIVERVKKNEISNIKKGDILVYTHDKRLIVHRVIKILNLEKETVFVTKGDNNNAKDSWFVKKEDITGIVKLRIKYAGMPTIALYELLNK